MLNKTYRRIACTIACCVPDCGTARRRRNAYEKSARENKLAIPMNTRSGRGTPRNVTRSGFGGLGSRVGSFTNITMRTEMTAGIAARKRIIRYEPSTVIAAPTVVRRTSVSIGPAIAPLVSMLRWKPNALPRVSAGVDSVSSASRGASRIPLPVRSRTRIPRNSGHDPAKGNKTFIAVERPYPVATNRFRFPAASDSLPEKIFMNETTLSESPSTSPRIRALASRTCVRKNGRMGRIISLLMSVKSDTTPSTTTFVVRPYARVRRVTAMPSRRMEEERHRNHRVHHDEQGPLVPIAAAVGHHGGHDGGREDQGRELENLEVEGHRLREEQRNEHEDGGHEERDLRRGRRGHGHAELHLVPVRHQDRAPMLARVADDRDDDDPDEQIREAETRLCRFQRADEDLALDGDQCGGDEEHRNRERSRPSRTLLDLRHGIEDVLVGP